MITATHELQSFLNSILISIGKIYHFEICRSVPARQARTSEFLSQFEGGNRKSCVFLPNPRLGADHPVPRDLLSRTSEVLAIVAANSEESPILQCTLQRPPGQVTFYRQNSPPARFPNQHWLPNGYLKLAPERQFSSLHISAIETISRRQGRGNWKIRYDRLLEKAPTFTCTEPLRMLQRRPCLAQMNGIEVQ